MNAFVGWLGWAYAVCCVRMYIFISELANLNTINNKTVSVSQQFLAPRAIGIGVVVVLCVYGNDGASDVIEYLYNRSVSAFVVCVCVCV